MIRKIRFILFLSLILAILAACASPSHLAKIDRHPSTSDYSFIDPDPTPPGVFDTTQMNPFQFDYRSSNLSKLDLTQSLEGLLYSDFDTQTVWPSAEKLPVGFDPQKIMESGKDPGLGVRQLHIQGITGSGVGIAIIDQPMLVEHQEYMSQLKLYEEINVDPSTESQMHGPAVASIAVGKTVGVAPEANLYFIADWPGTFDGAGGFDYDFSYLAKAVRRILEINKSLPSGRKIRVISMSIGWKPDRKGYSDIVAAVNEAKESGIFVVSMSIHDTYGWNMMGLGRSPLADPNEFYSYMPAVFWSGEYYDDPNILSPDTLLIPMDARATASPTGNKDYAFYSVGGMSWTAPYLAGIYALACQIDPEITPEEFWFTALKTGKTTRIEHNGKQYSFGTILDPKDLITALQK
jgi:hypothetical protein